MSRKFAVLSAASLIAAAGLVAVAEPTAPATGSAPKAPATQTLTIVETAAASPSFKTFVAAVNAAGLADALQGPGPFTVFIPTDAAFAKLPAGTLENLLKPENKAQLANILKYHVIAGDKLSGTQVAGMKESSKTLQGTTFQILSKEGKVFIGNDGSMAAVTKTDIAASNGVIHVIDTVILPK